MSRNKLKAGKRSGSRIGIRWKMFAYMMLFILILLTLLWSFQVAFFEEIYKFVKIEEIKRAGNSISQNCDLPTEQVDSLAERVAQNYDVCVLVFDEYGYIISTQDYLQDCIIHKMDVSNILMLYYFAKQNGGEKLSRFPRNDFKNLNYYNGNYNGQVPGTDEGLGESIIYTKIVHSSVRQRDVVVILNTTISPVGSTVRTLRTELIIITAAMSAVALILSFLLARRVASPIVRINAGAKLLAGGNYDVRFQVGGYREIDELSDTLSYAAEELSKTGALQRELIANISHDLRTPLTMIEGYAEVMRDIPGENTPENFQIIIEETKRLSSLVNDLLDISKLQSGTQQLRMEEFNLTETIREVIERFVKLTEQDGWVIRFNAAEEVMVKADRTRILQVVYNFINNAITHSGTDKLVIVDQKLLGEANQSVRIEVTDHGEGIAASDLPHIWDRYYKVDKTHKRAQTGSGLGLSIVKSILEMHNARYGVESELGKGSTFWFDL